MLDEHPEVEAALQRLVAIVESSEDAILSKSLDGVITSWNPGAERLYGYSATEAVGQPISMLIPPDHRDEVPEILKRIRRGDRITHYETLRVRRDGTPVEVSLAISPIKDRTGTIIGASTIARDITEWKQADAARHQLAAVAESSEDAILSKSLDGVITSWNPGAERLYGYSATEAVGQPISMLIPPDHRDEVPEILKRVRRGERIAHYETVRVRKDGTPVDVSLAISPIKDHTGTIIGASSIARDITEWKHLAGLLQAAKSEAERANQAKSEFLSRMSHELRTPLNAILGFGQLLEMEAREESQRESVRHILKGGQHLLGLINEVLDMARIESGKFSLSLEPVAVAELVAEVVDLVTPLAATRDITIETVQATGPGHAVADRQRLKQVLLNLASNAVKYNRHAGTVRLFVSHPEQGKIRLNVADTGPGIAPEDVERLFTPFERLQAEQTEVEGTGLGLAFSKVLAEAMGGAIGVETELGKGSTFWIELASADTVSLDSPAEHVSVSPPATQALQTDAPTRTLLYIEDNASNLRLIERLLVHRPNIELLTAMQGGLGVELARMHRPDLIVLDLHLPDVQGDEVLAVLRSDPSTSDIPVVMLSADATHGQIQRLLDAGANEYLTKPVDLARLLEVLDEHMRAKLETT